ncbi:MAG: SseB family protein [Pseudomonadota bacterium]
MKTPDLSALYQAALATDAQADWHQVWQALAGTGLVLALEDGNEERMTPRMASIDGIDAVEAFPGMERFAAAQDAPVEYLELDGAQLAAMLAPEGVPLAVRAEAATILVPPDALAWIAQTFRADVNRSETAGVVVMAPDLPPVAVVQAMGETVGALGQDCPEAWLIAMAEPDEEPELVLVLGLSDAVREMEGEIAETVTRAIQAVSEKPVAVACPGRGSPLMDRARRTGIGIGG